MNTDIEQAKKNNLESIFLVTKNICLFIIFTFSVLGILSIWIFESDATSVQTLYYAGLNFLLISLAAFMLISSKNSHFKIAGDVLIFFMIARQALPSSLLISTMVHIDSIKENFGPNHGAKYAMYLVYIITLLVLTIATVLNLLQKKNYSLTTIVCSIAFVVVTCCQLLAKFDPTRTFESSSARLFDSNSEFVFPFIFLAVVLLLISQASKYIYWPTLLIFTTTVWIFFYSTTSQFYLEHDLMIISLHCANAALMIFALYKIVTLNPEFNFAKLKNLSDKVIKPYEED